MRLRLCLGNGRAKGSGFGGLGVHRLHLCLHPGKEVRAVARFKV